MRKLEMLWIKLNSFIHNLYQRLFNRDYYASNNNDIDNFDYDSIYEVVPYR